jgi:hypothetical protein
MSRRRFELPRRTLLRGLLGGTSVAVALPILEMMLNDNGTALANGNGLPKRFGWWFFGNGVHADKWVPEGSGPDWELSPQLMPLAEVKSEVTVVSGLKVYLPNSVPHGSGPAGILTGGPLGVVGDSFGNSSFGGKTLDQIVADEIGNDTRFKSIEVAIERSDDSLSYAAAGMTNPPEYSPIALFERVFGSGFVEPGDEPIIDPKLSLRRSVLDAISDDATALQKRLGASDKARIAQHFDNIRALEKQLAKLEEDPPNLAACSKPGQPLDDYPDQGGQPQMSAISRAMSDMMAMILACDQTRVFSVQFSRPVSGVLYPGVSDSHHKLTHDELGEQPQVNNIILQIMDEMAYFLKALQSVDEGGSSLLDNCAVLGFSDCSFGKSHAIDNYPLLVAGSASRRLNKGIHYKSPSADNASKLGFSLLRAMDVQVTEFGSDAGRVTQGLDDIEL